MIRPTLKDQIALSKLTDEECIQLLCPRRSVSFWIHRHSEFLWTIIYWNWFDIWEGTEDADEYRRWFIKLKRKLFGG